MSKKLLRSLLVLGVLGVAGWAVYMTFDGPLFPPPQGPRAK